MSIRPDSDGLYRGVGELVIGAAVSDGKPVVGGRWGRTGFGYGTDSMRRAAHLILAACDEADALLEGGTDA